MSTLRSSIFNGDPPSPPGDLQDLGAISEVRPVLLHPRRPRDAVLVHQGWASSVVSIYARADRAIERGEVELPRRAVIHHVAYTSGIAIKSWRLAGMLEAEIDEIIADYPKHFDDSIAPGRREE